MPGTCHILCQAQLEMRKMQASLQEHKWATAVVNAVLWDSVDYCHSGEGVLNYRPGLSGSDSPAWPPTHTPASFCRAAATYVYASGNLRESGPRPKGSWERCPRETLAAQPSHSSGLWGHKWAMRTLARAANSNSGTSTESERDTAHLLPVYQICSWTQDLFLSLRLSLVLTERFLWTFSSGFPEFPMPYLLAW